MQVIKPILGRAMLVALPSAALLAAGRASLACWWFYAALFIILAYDGVNHRQLYCMALLLAATPLLLMVRDLLFYSSPEVLYAAALAQAPIADLKRLRANRVVTCLIVAALVYWLASFAYTRDYSSNSRALELALIASLIYLLAQHRSYLRPALLGYGLCCIAVGFGLFANGAMLTNGVEVFRLGVARVEGHNVGNPASFGLTVTVVFLLTISSSGRWLGLEGSRRKLLAVQLIIALWLILSTSRGSWAVALACAGIIYWAEPRRRRLLFGGAILLVVLGVALTLFTHDATLSSYLDRTFTGEASLDKMTTGRASQWASFPQAWSDAPLFGHGPGTSRQAGRMYFHKDLIYHALFLQIGVELGTFGLVLMFVFFYVVFRKAYRYYRLTGDPIALIGCLGYVIAGMSVPALDAASGSFLGLGLIGTDLSCLYYVANAPRMQALIQEDAVAAAK